MSKIFRHRNKIFFPLYSGQTPHRSPAAGPHFLFPKRAACTVIFPNLPGPGANFPGIMCDILRKRLNVTVAPTETFPKIYRNSKTGGAKEFSILNRQSLSKPTKKDYGRLRAKMIRRMIVNQRCLLLF